ncbi:MAG: alcohol dehydrogenase [Verrucomicrobiales bacterium]|nr:alcohol dehydrogenase [Verrucomicrobiales bacterium]
MNFEFATTTRIVFGRGKLASVGDIASEFGKSALIVTGKSLNRLGPLREQLNKAEIASTIYSIDGEPKIQHIRDGVERAKSGQCASVIAFGGGSPIDCGKAISAMLTNPGDVLDYLEVIGKGQKLTQQAAPFIAIPTTSGTGAEVTKNAVLNSPTHRVKASLRSVWMLPRVAIVDPELTVGLPKEITATTGMDALTQLIEPYTCCRTNPLTDAICRDGIPRAAGSLKRAFEYGDDIDAREQMAMASLFGGLALANSGLGAVHGVAAPIGGMFDAPHGAVCAALLPHVMSANCRALQERFSESEALGRYREISCWLVGNDTATVKDGLAKVQELAAELEIPKLGSFGIKESDVPVIVEKAGAASSMKANPLPLTEDELTQILTAAV